jgi:hypothetical protein
LITSIGTKKDPLSAELSVFLVLAYFRLLQKKRGRVASSYTSVIGCMRFTSDRVTYSEIVAIESDLQLDSLCSILTFAVNKDRKGRRRLLDSGFRPS